MHGPPDAMWGVAWTTLVPRQAGTRGGVRCGAAAVAQCAAGVGDRQRVRAALPRAIAWSSVAARRGSMRRGAIRGAGRGIVRAAPPIYMCVLTDAPRRRMRRLTAQPSRNLMRDGTTRLHDPVCDGQ